MIRAALPMRWACRCPVVPLELPSYQRKENWGAAETFYQLVRALRWAAQCRRRRASRRARPLQYARPDGLGFRHRDDVARGHGLLTSWALM
jgi:light-independent protochlorophyllide reductase subunit B